MGDCHDDEEHAKSRFEGQVHFSMAATLDLYTLVVSSLSRLPTDIWSQKSTDSRILEVLDFMHRNLEGKMTAETLAARLFMTPGAFSRLFQKNTGKTPSKYLKDLRLDRAGNLLLHTHAGIDNIAQQCGFVDRYHLTKAFAQAFGTAPAAFRKKAGYF